MAMKAVVEKLDDVDEAFRGEYKEIPSPTDASKKVFVLDVVDPGQLPDVLRLNTALGKERNEHKATKAKFAPFQAFGDPVKLQETLDRIPELEAAAAGNLDDTKINAIVEGRLKTKVAPLERELNQARQLLGEKDKTLGEMTAREKQRTIGDAVREAVTKSAGFLPGAIEDALLYGERHLEVDENNRVVTKEGVGVTPGVDAAVWLQEMQPKRAHWWGTTGGGGANGNRGGGGGGGDNPFSASGWNLTKQGELIRTDRRRAEQLAKSAGTTIGGPRPKAPEKK